MGKYSHQILRKVAYWTAKRAGLTILPTGFSMFNEALAKEVGVERAAIHQKIRGWQEHNQRYNKRSHFRRDHWWTYGTPEYWHKTAFIWTSLSTVRRAFDDLEKGGLMLRDRIDGKVWLCALAGETVNLKPVDSNLQLSLFDLTGDVSNRRSSIENLQSYSSSKHKRQPSISPRKDAVADFTLPETRNSVDVEIRESREGCDEGTDELAGLPSALIAGWLDTKIPLTQLVAKHGVDRVREAYANAQGFKNPIAGTRTLLAKSPAPSFALPPSPADEPTEPDWTEDDSPINQTPAIDVPNEDPNARIWNVVMSQLSLQLDSSTFGAWIKGATYLREEGGRWIIRARHANAAVMLQYTLYREVRRVLRDVRGEVVELHFEAAEVAS
jgi:hypothetical protein